MIIEIIKIFPNDSGYGFGYGYGYGSDDKEKAGLQVIE